MGVGDLTVPKRMKSLAESYLGRARTYAAALGEPGDETLVAALARNVYGAATGDQAPRTARLARYARQVEAELFQTPLSILERGPLVFPNAAEVD
jgi:cytochrome b pre-mRNA-processing protein 3